MNSAQKLKTNKKKLLKIFIDENKSERNYL